MISYRAKQERTLDPTGYNLIIRACDLC